MHALEVDHPDVFVAHMSGGFVVKRNPNPFTELSLDQSLEFRNRACSIPGGLVGIAHTQSAHDPFCLTSGPCANILFAHCLHDGTTVENQHRVVARFGQSRA